MTLCIWYSWINALYICFSFFTRRVFHLKTRRVKKRVVTLPKKSAYFLEDKTVSMNDLTNAIHKAMFSLIKYALCGITGTKFYGNFVDIDNVFASSIHQINVFSTAVLLYEKRAIFSNTGEYQSMLSPFQLSNTVSLGTKYLKTGFQ